ncbi:MAG TPA: AGE family epimerase/isomerase [Terriglobia bacterium]|nr:AGE family epimerase/isomerase [Terriglobia bacterium]
MNKSTRVLSTLALVVASVYQLAAQTQKLQEPPRDWPVEFRNVLQKNILQFWIDHATDNEYGGMIGWLGREGDPIPPGTKSLVQQSRVVWTFSAAYERYPEPAYKEVAEHTLKFLREKMWDKDHRGFNWLVDRKGKVLSDQKNLYGESFAIYALAEYARAFQDPAAKREALELFRLIDLKAHDNTNGGYFEAFTNDWSQQTRNLIAMNLPDRKSMNTHIHLLESLTTLYHVTGDPTVRKRVEELLNLCLNKIADSQQGYLRLYFTSDWKPAENSDTSSYGHDIELSWLLGESAGALGRVNDPQVKSVALALVDHTLRDGFDYENGGVYNEGPASGPAKNKTMTWWVQAEALTGLLNAYQLTGDQKNRDRFDQQASYVLLRFVDRQFGDWFNEIQPDGMITGDKTDEWKDPYHQSRACLEVIRRLESLRKK